MSDMEPLYLDIETNNSLDPLTGKVVIIQRLFGNELYINRPFKQTIDQLKEQVKNHVIVGHNIAFDISFLSHQYQIDPEHIFDTMIAEALISGGSKVNKKGGSLTLKALTKQYLDIDIKEDEDISTSFSNGNPLTTEQLEYAKMDVAVLPKIHRQQAILLREMGLEDVFQTEMRCIPATVWLKLSGIPINIPELGRVKKECESRKEDARKAILQLFQDSGFKGQTGFDGLPTIKLTSHKELLSALRSIGLDLQSTDKEALAGIEHPIGLAILKFKKEDKIIGYLKSYQKIVHPVTGRIHAGFKQYGTQTGRYSSSNPNLTNVPRDKDVRGLFQTNNGNRIITGDYSQIELRIIAELSQEPKFLNIYRTGGDLHSQTARLVFKRQPEETVPQEERQKAKTINFGFAYGLGVDGFIRKAKTELHISISKEEAEAFQKAFFDGYPVLNRFLEDMGRKAIADKKITNLAGRQAVIENPEHQYSDENKGKNYPIQSLSADITKIAMGELYVKLKPHHAKLINAIHDELVFEVPAEQAEAVKNIVVSEMVKAGERFIKTIPITVDVKISDRWAK